MSDHPYVHALSPYIIRFSDSFGLRWYGLAYVAGFYLGFLLLRRLARRGYTELRPEQAGDFIALCALFGVLLGGRLGYMLFYDWDRFVANPLRIFKVYDGGMASHGGILGLVAFTLWYAHRHRINWAGLGDNLVVVAPIGVFFGRLANFINGELYGRISGVPWAVVFPTSLLEGAPNDPVMWEEFAAAEPRLDLAAPWATRIDQVVEWARDNPALREAIAAHVPARHPSQLYEALLEGAVLFAVLYLVRIRFRRLPFGVLTGLFFLLYAGFRIVVEEFRQPDIGATIFLGGLSPGQFYSLFMIVIGIAFLAYGLTAGRRRALEAELPKPEKASS